MPDTKITALTAIGANPIIPSTFPIPMVDLSDTSMAASGTTKKVTVNQILGAGGTATLASATITGTLTVSAGTLALPSLTTAGDTNTGIYFPAADTIGFVEGGVEVMRINSAGNLVVNNAATITGNLTVDTNTLFVDAASNRVGIGTASPSGNFHVSGGTSGINSIFDTPSAGNTRIELRNNATRAGYVYWDTSEVRLFADSGRELTFYPNGTLGMTLNSTGLGVGVTPSVRFDSLVADATESARFRAASGWLRIHPYLNATDVCRLQSVNNTNTGLQNLTLEGFNLRFNTNSGTAMIIDNLMNTVSNVNSAVPSLGTNNTMVFNLTSNTNLRISVRGSDGTTRTANITLA